MSETKTETYCCEELYCHKKVTYREDRYFLADGSQTEGAWCHGLRHESPYFMCKDHFATLSDSQGDLPLTYCWTCVLTMATENIKKKE